MQVVAAATEAAQELGASHMSLVSRAYHDTLFMSQIAPAGMIFIPAAMGGATGLTNLRLLRTLRWA